MKFQEITQERLLSHVKIRSVDFEHEWYFVAQDINEEFMGAFNNLPSIPLPILINSRSGDRTLMRCIKYSDIQSKVDSLAGKSDFEIQINTVLNFNPKKK